MASQIGGHWPGTARAGHPALTTMTNPQAATAIASSNRTFSTSPWYRVERHNIGMELTHFGHSCLLADFKGDSGQDTTVLLDPGTFSHGFEGITGLLAIL